MREIMREKKRRLRISSEKKFESLGQEALGLSSYFKDSNIYPCRYAGTSEYKYCPKAGWGGCGGQYGDCDYEYIEKSIKLRNLLEGI